MAEITKPIALDESFNTTEGSPRNVADVLAQGIGDLVTVVSRISHQTTYDELSDLEDVNISAPTNGDVLTYDGSKWTNTQGGGGSVEQMIAPVETSTTASQSYAIGEQFILNGTLYTATAAITASGTITINGNCTASDSVTEQIKELHNASSGTRINISSYNSSTNKYTATSDGYLYIYSHETSGIAGMQLYSASGNLMASPRVQGQFMNQLIFCKKGFQMYVQTNSGNSNQFYYTPLI